MMNYRLAGPEDMDGVIDFANMVFSMLRVPHNFEEMLPKVYAEPLLQPEIHIVAEEEGRLCGCLGMLEYPLRVAGETLRVGYMGTMAVHPRVRGRGTMGTLMEKQIERGKALGLDVLLLGGQRQRYARHGYETVGTTYGYSISAANVRHAMTQVDAGGLSFAPMTQEDVPFALSLYDAQLVAGARTEENFLAAVKSYREKPYAVKRDGDMVGYLVAAQDGARISEIVMKDSGFILAAVKGYMQAMGLRSLRVDAAPHDTALNSLLASVCEGYTISPNCMLRMLKPERVIGAYMKLKAALQPLEDGRLTLGCGEAGAVEIAVTGGEVSVQRTQEAPQLALTDQQAAMLLFGSNRFAVDAEAQRMAPASWFPLPLHISEPDSF